MDQRTRVCTTINNPATLLALAWYWVGNGHGEKNMIVVPYRDRLELIPRYIQQLVMESVGKRFDRNGVEVRQGLSVYGNKGVTDQHAYFQQLSEGPDDFFTVFILVDRDQSEPTSRTSEITLGDYLFCSLEGTRRSLSNLGRNSITVTLPDLSAKSMGALMALFERAVGLYSELINVNAYNQPGVDKFAGKASLISSELFCRISGTPINLRL